MVIELTNKYLIPGLFDTHVHHATAPDSSDNDQITGMRLRNLLRGRVPSVRDMDDDTRALNSFKRRANNDIIQAPDIYYSVIIGGKEFFSDPRIFDLFLNVADILQAKQQKIGIIIGFQSTEMFADDLEHIDFFAKLDTHYMQMSYNAHRNLAAVAEWR